VYNGFDQVMLLSKGRQDFVGNANAASAYFDSIGHTLPPATNPAEHLLDIVNADFSSSEEVDKMIDIWAAHPKPDPVARNKYTRDSSDTLGDSITSLGLFRETKVTSLVCANGLIFLSCSGRSKSSTMSSLSITMSAVPCTSFSPKAHGNLVQIQRLVRFA
jgi:hypothetical protein